MGEDADGIRIVCARLDLVQLGRLRGNQARDCALCGLGIVLSREGQIFEANCQADGLAVELVCIPCAKKHYDQEQIMGAVPGSVERAQREGLPVSQRTVDVMNRTPIEEWPE